MPQINLVWNDADSQPQTYQLSLLETEVDKKMNIGRDQQRCNLWLNHNTVSRVHGEISFKPEWQRFYLRNLATKNPVRVDGGMLTKGEVALYKGSMVQFGQMLLQVSDIVVSTLAPHTHEHLFHAVPSTPEASVSHGGASPLTMPPGAPNQGQSQGVQAQGAQAQGAQGQGAQVQSVQSQSVSSPNVAPQLVCPKCQTMQTLSLRNSNCPVCGHFLADASSRYFF